MRPERPNVYRSPSAFLERIVALRNWLGSQPPGFWMALIVTVSIGVLVWRGIGWSPKNEPPYTDPRVIEAGFQPVEAAALPTPASGAAPLRGELSTVQSADTPDDTLTLVFDPGLYEGQSTQLGPALDAALADVVARTGYQPAAPFEVRFLNDASCALSGATYDEARAVLVYTCNAIDSSRAVSILAHEFVHQLAYDRFGPRAGRSDLMLVEGLATYGAGKYWLGGYASFRDLVRDQRAAGVAYPLTKNYFNTDAATMNAIYYQWASFVEFLLDDSSGYRGQFEALYTTGDNTVGSANYAGVLGKDLGQLEQEWQAWLDRP